MNYKYYDWVLKYTKYFDKQFSSEIDGQVAELAFWKCFFPVNIGPIIIQSQVSKLAIFC